MIPLACSVDDDTFLMVSALCGEEAAWKLCYTDAETYLEVKTVCDIILNGHPMANKRRSEAQ